MGKMPEITLDSLLSQIREEMTGPVTPTRFSLPFAEDVVGSLLSAAYSRQVAERAVAYVQDGHTGQRIAKVARWLVTASMKPMLLLYGGVGNGKTTMANAVAYMFGTIRRNVRDAAACAPFLTTAHEDGARRKEWERLGCVPEVRVVTAQSLADLAKRESPEYGRARTAPFLVIDDLGCEPQTVKVYGTEVTPVTDILYVRYDRRLPTIVTTNLRIQDIRDVYGERLADRFNEVFERIGYTNKSYRRA